MSAINQVVATYKSASTNLVMLTGGLIVGHLTPTVATNVVFNTNGTHTLGTTGSPVNVPGEWYTTSPVVGIGSSYQARFVVEAGSAPLTAGAFTGGNGIWGTISAASTLQATVGTRYRVEIRDIATSTLQASAQFWTTGFEP